MFLGQNISNKEKQINIINKIFKGFFIGFITLLVIDLITFIIIFTNKIGPFEENETKTCSSYIIENMV